MSGAIVIEGMERYFPEVKRLRERVMVVRGRSIAHDPNADELRKYVEIPLKKCGGEAEAPEEIFTVNGALRPQIEISPNERQFWRVVNASADRYLDLQLDGGLLEILALDGMPLASHDPQHPTRTTNHVLLSPAGRVEAIVSEWSVNARNAEDLYPLWGENLRSTGQLHLYLVRSEGGTPPHPRHRDAVMRMISIVDGGGAQNMASV